MARGAANEGAAVRAPQRAGRYLSAARRRGAERSARRRERSGTGRERRAGPGLLPPPPWCRASLSPVGPVTVKVSGAPLGWGWGCGKRRASPGTARSMRAAGRVAAPGGSVRLSEAAPPRRLLPASLRARSPPPPGLPPVKVTRCLGLRSAREAAGPPLAGKGPRLAQGCFCRAGSRASSCRPVGSALGTGLGLIPVPKPQPALVCFSLKTRPGGVALRAVPLRLPRARPAPPGAGLCISSQRELHVGARPRGPAVP